MKEIIRSILAAVMCAVSKVYTYEVGRRFSRIRNLFYTLWIKNFFGEFGKNSTICCPCKLWGGGSKRIIIGDNTCVQAHCILGCWLKYNDDSYSPSLIIGKDCNIGEHTHISSINGITIGDGLLTGRYVYIGDNSHGGLSYEEKNIPPVKRRLLTKGEIRIGDNVWIGDKVTILSGVTIGDNVIIGANSVVTHNIPSNSMAGGIPARIIKELNICQNQD